jgi:transposase
LTGLHRNSAALFYHKLRELIADKIAEVDPEFGAFEVDESYFGGIRKGRRGRGAPGKAPGVRHSQARRQGACASGRRRQRTDSADGAPNQGLGRFRGLYRYWPSSNILDVAGFKHHRVNHAKSFATKNGHHINGIETSGTKPSACSGNTTACPAETFICSSK